MNRIRGKLNQYHQDIRKDKREKIMAEKRVWKEMPSVIVELPYCIDHSHWSYIEELLDSIAQQDIAILDKALITYIEDKYNAEFDKFSPKEWQQPLKFNILRIIMRLRLAKDYHTCKLLKLLEDANQNLNKEFTINRFQVFLKLIKELAIFLQVTEEANEENHKIWNEDNLILVNHICSNLQIYRFDSSGSKQFTSLLNKYHLYYVYLLAESKIDFKQQFLTKNAGQIYQLIDRCLYSSDSLQISKSIDIINKIIICINYQNKNSLTFINSLEILLIDGYESCKKFLSSSSEPKSSQIDLTFTGSFFNKLLSLVSNADILTVIKIIQHLAKLIELSDNFIEAIFKVSLLPTRNETFNNMPDNKHQSEEKQVIILRPKQFKTYSEFLFFQMQNLLCEVRYKAYWLISNILGSDKYFSEYGLQFLRQIYCNNYLDLQRGSANIQNEIYFCILNYFCNITNRIHIIDLMAIKSPSNIPVKANEQNCNSFYYFMNILMSMMEKLSQTVQNQGLSFYHGKEDIFLHRIIYSFYNLLKVVKEQKEIEGLSYQTLMNVMEKSKIGLYMQQILDKIQGSDQISSEVQSLVELILKYFSGCENEQKLL